LPAEIGCNFGREQAGTIARGDSGRALPVEMESRVGFCIADALGLIKRFI